MPLYFPGTGNRKPLVDFATRERASLVSTTTPSSSTSMPRKTRRQATPRKRSTRRRSKRLSGTNKIRIVGGRVRLRIAGYQGVQALAPSALVRFIPTTKLRLAARRVLRQSGKASTGRRRKRRATKGRRKRRVRRVRR